MSDQNARRSGTSVTEAVRIGRGELLVAISGKGLVPTASGAACCSCSSSSSVRRGKN